jgi:hypothetical protein
MWQFLLAAVVTTATPGPVQMVPAVNLIDNHPIYTDSAVWIYQGNRGYGYSAPINGTAERIDVLPPNVTAAQIVEALELFRHPMDFQGYPMRISLVDKLFAIDEKINYIIAPTAEGTRQYYTQKPAYDEQVLHGPGPGAFTASGPFPANGVIADEYKPAFAYATKLLSLANLPAGQKDLSHYGVMFIDTPTVTWIEFGPVFAPGETPHLGCQTQLGRDMVFAYEKNPADGKQGGPFIQCF